MASASVKALEQPTVEVVTGAYRVASTLVKVQTESREELYNLTQTGSRFRQIVRRSGRIGDGFVVAYDVRHSY